MILYLEHSWSYLLKQYMDKEINEEEMEEFNHYINLDPICKQQFKQYTDPHEFTKQLRYYRSLDSAWSEAFYKKVELMRAKSASWHRRHPLQTRLARMVSGRRKTSALRKRLRLDGRRQVEPAQQRHKSGV